MSKSGQRGDRLLLAALAHPWLTLLGLALLWGLGALGDLAQPVLPAISALTVAAALGVAFGLLLARIWPQAGWPRAVIALAVLLLLGYGAIGAVQWQFGGKRGLLASRFPPIAAWQEEALGLPPPLPAAPDLLRAALSDPAAPLRPRPISADEYLYNALLLWARDQPLPAAQSLAEALRLAPDPRPDALLLHDGLMGAATPEIAAVLADWPEDLAPEARTHFTAMRITEPPTRVAALDAALAADPDSLAAMAALAQALVAASLPQGPTLATAARIADIVSAFADDERFQLFAEAFLDRMSALRLRAEVASLAWTRDVAARRLEVAAQAPPPGLTGLPILLRVTAPEPATAIEYFSELEGWRALTQAEEDPAPTLRMAPPFRPQTVRLRYRDRDGIASAVLNHAFDPVAAIRDQAQRNLQRQGPFAFYLPGRVAPGRLNALGLPGHLRAGLSAVEWATDADTRPRLVPVAVPDETVLVGDAQRVVIEFTDVPNTARSLLLTAIFADGSRSATTELAIR